MSSTRRRAAAVARSVHWPRLIALALAPLASAVLWLCLARALILIGRLAA